MGFLSERKEEKADGQAQLLVQEWAALADQAIDVMEAAPQAEAAKVAAEICGEALQSRAFVIAEQIANSGCSDETYDACKQLLEAGYNDWRSRAKSILLRLQEHAGA